MPSVHINFKTLLTSLLLKYNATAMKIEDLAGEFTSVQQTIADVLPLIPEDKLYWKPFQSKNHVRIYSCGELISHAMGTIETACNGILNNFWDDPFEWTLRESLPNHEYLMIYINEVRSVTKEAFSLLKTEDLPKRIYLPNGEPTTIGKLLLRALLHAVHHRGQLYAYVHLFSEAKLPRAY
ncbi:MAG TPA: DinB family protein [Blastocatellia bacterium]|nr:DinB family protein [Blastocatellia bacterium]